MKITTPGKSATTPHTLKYAAALTLTLGLAACGSGSDNGGGSEPASQLQTKNNTPAQSSDAANGGAANASGNNDTAKPVATGEDVQPISDQGVRGDVVATALRTVGGTSGDNADTATEELIGVRSNHSDTSQNSRTEEFMASVTQSIRIAEGDDAALGTFLREENLTPAESYSHRSAIKPTRLVFGMSAKGALPPETAHAAADTDVLQLGTQARFTFPDAAKNQRGDQTADDATLAYQAASPVIIRKGTVYPYEDHQNESEAIQTWNSPQQDNETAPTGITIHVSKSSLNNSFELCAEKVGYGHTQVNRLDCDAWEVPENWVPGKALVYKGHRISIRESYEYPWIDGQGNLMMKEWVDQYHEAGSGVLQQKPFF